MSDFTLLMLIVGSCFLVAIVLALFSIVSAHRDRRLLSMRLSRQAELSAAELRRNYEQLSQLDQLKDEFVGMASHQLRTPLTSVKGYISMVLEGDGGPITPMQRQLLEEAFTSSERMVRLINDYLSVSRLQTGRFTLERTQVDIAKIVANEISALQPMAHAHGIQIRLEHTDHIPILSLDEAKIRQVIMNFIDNAIYYSPKGDDITVRLADEDAAVVLEVIDHGMGVPKAERSQLFTKFFRATNARKQRPDGTGVGLFLAKRIIEEHGGSIVFRSREGRGSTFGFRIPLSD